MSPERREIKGCPLKGFAPAGWGTTGRRRRRPGGCGKKGERLGCPVSSGHPGIVGGKQAALAHHGCVGLVLRHAVSVLRAAAGRARAHP